MSLTPAVNGTVTYGEGLKDLGNGIYEIVGDDDATVTVPISSPDGGPVVVKTFRVMSGGVIGETSAEQARQKQEVSFAIEVPTSDLTQLDSDKNAMSWVSPSASDGAWGDFSRTLTYTSMPSTQYMFFGQTRGTYHADAVRLAFSGGVGTRVSFGGLVVNATIPFRISAVRVLLELAVMLFLIAFRPSSQLYRLSWRELKEAATGRLRCLRGTEMAAMVLFTVLSGIAMLLMARRGPAEDVYFNAVFNHWVEPYQYQLLADSLIHGHTWLDLPVDDALKALSNPYAYADRYTLGSEGHVFYFDHAYYDGHYYSYFGVVPCLLLFVPFQLILGRSLPTCTAIGIFAAIAIVMTTLLVRRLIRDYAPNTSVGFVWLAMIGVNLGLNITYYCSHTTFYSVPIICSIALTMTGLYCWQCSKKRDGSVSPWLVALGSLFIALNFGSRPQFLIVCVLAFPLFSQQILRHRALFSKRGWRATVGAFAPFIVAVLPLAYYNYIRFGSWLNFGQNYNLTGFDMTAHTLSVYRLPFQLFTQMFQPFATKSNFPFFTATNTTLGAPNEPSEGGYFALVPLALFALFAWIVRRRLSRMHTWSFVWISVLCGFVVCVVDSLQCGTAMRYYGDFAFLMILAALFSMLAFVQVLASVSVARTIDAESDEHRGRSNWTGVATANSDIASAIGSLQRVSFTTTVVVVETAVLVSAVVLGLGFFVSSSIAANTYYSTMSWFVGICG
ncbi:glycosyltransferase [Bifidobacterium choloepi]|uniref:Glycosyltransferase n=1 Tax=Bifidobacterium choloepi TaxID=2614131 RepID=A0A6I5N1X2_9BIFI|nr:glycosyltransferase [Bifidobacterium choloepi]NEG70476.1 glycosyltransferase [Bifidobacterium choloepi]